jgi:hypothetical protein
VKSGNGGQGIISLFETNETDNTALIVFIDNDVGTELSKERGSRDVVGSRNGGGGGSSGRRRVGGRRR